MRSSRISTRFGALVVLLVATVEECGGMISAGSDFPMTMLIATSKGALILWIFMGLQKSTSLTRLFAAGFLWLGILLALTAADYLTRAAASTTPDIAKPAAVPYH